MRIGSSICRGACLVCAAILCVGLVGCSEDDNPDYDSGLPSESQASTSSSPTSPAPSTPTETPPTLPPHVNGTSPADAKAFARHVVDVINYAKRTYDVGVLGTVFAPSCRICTNGIKNVRDLAHDHARVEGGIWKLEFLRYVPERPRDNPLLDIVISVDHERIFRPDSNEPEINQGFRDNYTWELNYTRDGGWKVVDWRFVE